jgi:nicotinamide-nucleotide amidase
VIFSSELTAAAGELVGLLQARQLMLATAESCTGGLLAALMTEISGSSRVFDRGFVTYSNDAKAQILGVSRETLTLYGAVSEQTAHAMAAGALSNSGAGIAVSITGIAGPGGGTKEKPVGLVFVACMRRGAMPSVTKLDLGDRGRSAVRLAAVDEALALLRSQLDR